MMQYRKTQNRKTITLAPDLLAEVKLRGDNVSAVIADSLTRYYGAFDNEWPLIRKWFGDADLAEIFGCLKGKRVEVYMIPLLYVIVGAGGNNELADRLRALSYIECAALIDAAERYWRRVASGEAVTPGELLR